MRSIRMALSIAMALLMLAPLSIRAQVQASLIAADKSVQPGHPLTVALRLDQQLPWHTYWIIAGTAYSTSTPKRLVPSLSSR